MKQIFWESRPVAKFWTKLFRLGNFIAKKMGVKLRSLFN